MSTARYFVTEQEEAAKNWQMIQQGKRLKATVARLENELLLFSVSWSKLGSVARTIEDIDYNAFHADSDNIKVSRPQSHDGGKILVIATLPAAHFDFGSIKNLMVELEGAKAELNEIKRQLRDLEVSL